MGRFLAGSIAALLLVAAGLFWWQGEADRDARPLVANGGAKAQAPVLPGEGDLNATGAAPPPEADPLTREQKRFGRYDRDRNGAVTRAEMLSTRTAAFKKLDKDGNNLLSFEEWAVRTSDRFAGADGDRDGKLTPVEFATTAPERKLPGARQTCACAEEQ